MTNMIEMLQDIKSIVDVCKDIYWDRRDTVKEVYREKLIKHQKENNTKNLLASAIVLSKDADTKEVIVYIGACF